MKYNVKYLTYYYVAPIALCISLLSLQIDVAAQTHGAPSIRVTSAVAPVHLQGTLLHIEGRDLTVKNSRGEHVNLVVALNTIISETSPINISEINKGSFISSFSMLQANGTLRATQLLLFPEEWRGYGEGHRSGYQIQNAVTNATVEEVKVTKGGGAGNEHTLRLKYEDGEKILVVPIDAQIVKLKATHDSKLEVGDQLNITAEYRDGKYVATRITAGRNGFKPPMYDRAVQFKPPTLFLPNAAADVRRSAMGS